MSYGLKVLKSYTRELSQLELKYLDATSLLATYKTDNTFNDTLNKKLSILDKKLNNLISSLKTGVLTDRKFLNETFGFRLGIVNKNFINSKIKNNIITLSKSVVKTEGIVISNNLFTSEYNTRFTIQDNSLKLSKNSNENFQQVSINIPKNIYSGYITLEFNIEQDITVLDRYNNVIVSRKLSNEFIIPFDSKTIKISLRFNTNKNEEILFINKMFTEEIYSTDSTVITQPIIINKVLSQLALSTCDNYSDSNVSIEYFIKVNNEDFVAIKPLNKDKDENKNSILTTTAKTTTSKLTEYVKNNSVFNFPLKDSITFINKQIFENSVFEINKINSEQFYINTSEDFSLVINNGDSITLNDVEYTSNTDKHTIVIPKGINKLGLETTLFNQYLSLKDREIVELNDKYITYKDKDRFIKITINYDIELNNSIFYQLLKNNVEIYQTKVVYEEIIKDSIVYISKQTPNPIHIVGKSKDNLIESLQLKIVLKTLNNINIPYITDIYVKGS